MSHSNTAGCVEKIFYWISHQPEEYFQQLISTKLRFFLRHPVCTWWAFWKRACLDISTKAMKQVYLHFYFSSSLSCFISTFTFHPHCHSSQLKHTYLMSFLKASLSGHFEPKPSGGSMFFSMSYLIEVVMSSDWIC